MTNNDWPQPQLFSREGEPETPDIPTKLLPGDLGLYCQAVTDYLQTPPGLSVMLTLSAVSACVQKKFEVELENGYREPINLWSMTVLEPGSRKTSAINMVTQPHKEWEAREAERLLPESEKQQLEKAVYEKKLKNLITYAAKPELTENERKLLLKEAKEAQAKAKAYENSHTPKVWTDDISPANLQECLAQNNGKMAVFSDEGGLFETLSSLTSRNVNVYLQSHSGADVRVGRLSRSVDLRRPALTMGLTVQPQVLGDLARGRKSQWTGNGLLDRFLYCLPTNTVGSRDMAVDRPYPVNEQGAYCLAIDYLLDLDSQRVRILKLEKNAYSAWLQFRQQLEGRMADGQDLEGIREWASKLANATLRIAANCHLYVQVTSGPKGLDNMHISQDTIERSIQLCELLIDHALSAFEVVGGGRPIMDARRIYTWLVSSKISEFKMADIYRALRRFNDAARVSNALKVLTNRHIITEPTTIGRTKLYYVNPAIH